jgi:xylose isomerase
MRHFDAHAYRTEDQAGVWEFARGCMRTYLILAEKAARFADDADIQDALAAARVAGLSEPTSPTGLGPDALESIRSGSYDLEALAAQGYGNERVDQLVNELLLGVR